MNRLVAVGLLLSGCHGLQPDTALATLQPVYGAVMQACQEREAQILELARLGFKPAYEAQFNEVSKRCHDVRLTFEAAARSGKGIDKAAARLMALYREITSAVD